MENGLHNQIFNLRKRGGKDVRIGGWFLRWGFVSEGKDHLQEITIIKEKKSNNRRKVSLDII